MKAILVIDLPESCEECPFCDDFYYCIPEKAKGYVAFTEKSGRQEWCPLKPIPNRITERGKWISEEYQKGWNACVEVLEK